LVIGDILQPTHLLFILVIALLVLGPKRLPEVGRSLGRGLRDFRSALNSVDPREEIMGDIHMTDPVGSPTPAPAEAPVEPVTRTPSERTVVQPPAHAQPVDEPATEIRDVDAAETVEIPEADAKTVEVPNAAAEIVETADAAETPEHVGSGAPRKP
jgi:sec-independent protein translocase protein TatA